MTGELEPAAAPTRPTARTTVLRCGIILTLASLFSILIAGAFGDVLGPEMALRLASSGAVLFILSIVVLVVAWPRRAKTNRTIERPASIFTGWRRRPDFKLWHLLLAIAILSPQGWILWVQTNRIAPWTIPSYADLKVADGILLPETREHHRRSLDRSYGSIKSNDGSIISITCTPGEGDVDCLSFKVDGVPYEYGAFVGHKLSIKFFSTQNFNGPENVVMEIVTEGRTIKSYELRRIELNPELVRFDHANRYPNIWHIFIILGYFLIMLLVLFTRQRPTQPLTTG